MDDRPSASLLLLAGGSSRRMGRPKPLLPVAGTTLVEYVAKRLEAGFAELLVSANDDALVPAALRERARVVHDLHLGEGPLAGIEAGLAATANPVLVAVACDMPYVTPALAARLAASCVGRDAAVPVVAGRPEPACAGYAVAAAGPVAAALGAGRRRARDVLESLDVAWLADVNADELRSLNTPDEYRAFLDAVR